MNPPYNRIKDRLLYSIEYSKESIYLLFELKLSRNKNKNMLQSKRVRMREVSKKNSISYRWERDMIWNYQYRAIYLSNWWTTDICDLCNKKINYMEVHHLNKNYKDNQLSNLVGICMTCHIKEHEWEPVSSLMKSKMKTLIKKWFIV